ncbi:FtsH protease activity modulator HflK [Motiliproteus sp. MSK22-1]|uniref:FtsH protease activity modulator HflK n=1 Tax=Motiliproteus sp. MSK22-1 TaxID=1897630 RepID=UPI0009782796|nr:FtsH protease activity modulator HflK [Motiliproteus sp. MSK22-1]OMH31819.1 HflK protein [Motiliproteus sp. MSK22-1]
MAWNEPGGNGNNQDPWGGGKRDGGKRGGGDQGPPDLDEALKKLQDKMNSIFGGGGGGSKSSGSGQGNSVGIGFIALLAVVLLGGWVAMGFYTVNEQERVVILRLGQYHDTVMPGLRWNPRLIDKRYTVNVTRVESIDHRALMLTEDENIVDVALKVQYKISNPENYVLKVRDPETSLAHATESALRHVVGTSEMHFVLTEGRAVLGSAVQERLQGYMDDYGTGLLISKVNIESTSAPSQVQAAFDDVIKAREDEQRVKNEAESYANGIVPEARGQSQRLLEEANAYREQVTARSEGETNRFLQLLSEYKAAPEVTRERLYLDAVESVMESSTKVLLDVKGGNNMMYLPLDKIVQSGGGSSQRLSGFSSSLDEASVQEVADEVIDRLRRRQAARREER